MNLTNVIFTFYDIKGEPIADTPFTIQLIRSGFDKQIGVVVPTLIEVVTDSSGMAMVALAPSSTPYYVQIDGYGACSKQSYKFYVPEVDHDVPFQELIDTDELDPAVITDEKIKLIIEASILSKDSAAAAKVSETNAKASEVAADESEANAKASEDAAKLAQTASQNNADSALASENAAKTSETNAKASETAAKASQTAAKTSETNAKTSETNAAASAFTATNEAGKAAASATAAKTSETNAKASETQTAALKNSVDVTAVTVQQTKNDMETLYNQAVAIGSGWAPVMRIVADGQRYVLQVTDWTGGRGTKPAIGYMGATGVVAAIGSAADIRGGTGKDGTSFQVNATGTLAERAAHNSKPAGFAYLTTDNGLLYIRETATAGVWSPGIPFGKGDKGDKGDIGLTGPQGVKGDKGDTGATGPTNKLTIGTVTTGTTSSATITGTAPNQILNLTLQKGDKGDKGDTGLGFTQAQYDKLDGIETGAQKNVPTNLSMGIANATTQTVLSSTGTSAVIPQATITAAGLLSATDKVKLNGAAPLASPTFTGTVNAPTPSNSSDSTIVATTAFVRSAMKVNGFSDIFGQNVRYINSSGTAVAPWNDANTFPSGSQALVDRNFVANCPEGENLWYIETKANYRADQGLWQIAQGYQQGQIWHRWATSSNIYGAWRQLMATDGANMTGQLGVLNQTSDNNSIRAANTAFVHGAMNFYGVAQGLTDASAADRLTASGSGPTNDMNLMVGQYGGGTYTLAGTYLNGPLGASATYTGVMQITRRKYNAGSAVVMTVYQGSSAVGWVRTWNGTTWTAWEKQASESSNVASATKLQTARNITVGNTTKTFDGTADIAFTAADMGIVGQNLLFNSDFTKGMVNTSALRGYTRGGSATGLSLAVVDYDPVGKYYSVARKAARIECTASNVNQYIDMTTDTNLPVPALPGQVFTSSVKFRGTPGADFRTYIQFRNDTGAVIQTATSPVVASKDTWQTMELTTAVAPAGTINAHVYIGRLQRNNSSPSAMWLELAEPQFQEGSYATPYAPSTVRSNSGDGGMLISGDDFNKMVIDGDYVAWAAPNTMPNAPQTATWGTLRVVRGGNRIYQSFLLDTSPYLTWNRVSKDGGNTWTAWANTGTDLGVSYGAGQVAVTSSDGTNALISAATEAQAGVMSTGQVQKLNSIDTGATKDWKGTIISTGADLNSFISPGSYVANTNAIAASLVNAPPANNGRAFGLEVYATAGVVQIAYAFDRSRSWTRTWYNFTDTWSAWKENYGEDFPQTTTTTDAPGTNNTNIASTAFVQTAVSNAINSLDRANIKEPIATAAVTGSTRYSGRTLGAYFDGIYGGGALGYPVNYGSRMLIVPRIVGSAQPQQELVFEWNGDGGVGQDRVFYRSISDIPANTWKPYKEFAFTASPAFTGTPTAPTASAATNNTQLATTAFVQAVNSADTGSAATAVKLKTARTFQISGTVAASAVSFDGTGNVNLVVNGLDVAGATAGLLPTARGGTGTASVTGSGSNVFSVSPAFTGTPTAPTAATTTNTTQLATTAFVQAVNTADTGSSATSVALKTARNFSITGGATAAAVGFDGQDNVVLEVTALDISKATAGTLPVVRGGTGTTTSTGSGNVVLSTSPALGGVPTAPTAATTTNTTQIATTAHVQAVNLAETGAAAYALKLKTAQNFSITGGATAAVKDFDGTGAVVLEVTALDVSKATAGTLAVALGGTGTTTSTGSGANVLATSPALGGTPTAPTAAATVNNTQVATTAFVKREVANPTYRIDQKMGAVGSSNWMQSWGWTGKQASFAWEMMPDESIQLISVNKDTGVGKLGLMRWYQDGKVSVPTYLSGRLENNQYAPAVWQKANIGAAFNQWTGDTQPVTQIDASDPGAAYMIWRATRWGSSHLAAMHIHESTSTSGTMVTMSLAGITNAYQWYSQGDYSVAKDVYARGVKLTSDERLKDVTGKVTDALATNGAMAKVMFNMKNSTETSAGYLAQSVEKVAPWAVTERDARAWEKPYVGDKAKVVDYNAVSVIHGAAIDELHEMILALKAEIAELKKGK